MNRGQFTIDQTERIITAYNSATEAERMKHDEKLNQATGSERRNSPCPCGSGLKFKHCCGKLN